MSFSRYSIQFSVPRSFGARYVRQSAEQQPAEATSAPAHGSYGSLLFDPRWKARRSAILKRDGEACVICRGKGSLQVHHRQYQFIKAANAFRMPWDYPDHLLITLCNSCHQRGHSKFKIPTLIL